MGGGDLGVKIAGEVGDHRPEVLRTGPLFGIPVARDSGAIEFIAPSSGLERLISLICILFPQKIVVFT